MKTLLIHKMNFRRNYITESENMNAWLHCRDSISDRLNKKGKYMQINVSPEVIVYDVGVPAPSDAVHEP